MLKTVLKEIKQHRGSALRKFRYIPVSASSKGKTGGVLQTMCRLFSLDVGETEALSVMEQKPGAIFLTDDASVRFVTERMGYKARGTIGILVRGIRRGDLEPSELLKLLSDIPSRSTLYIKCSLLEEIKGSIREKFGLLGQD